MHKLLTGRRKAFPTLRQYKGLSGFPDIKESKYDPFICGHSGHAISAALGISCADKINGNDDRKAIAIVGDAAIAAGMSLEALNHAGHLKRNLIVILNDNKMAISGTDRGDIKTSKQDSNLTTLYRFQKGSPPCTAFITHCWQTDGTFIRTHC